MARSLEVQSTLTDRYQTTIPETVRRALQLGKRDRIHYVIRPDGEVLLTRAAANEDDPAIGEFIGFLARDIAAHPEHVKALGSALVKRVRSLVADVDVDVDLDARLSADDE